MADNTFATAFKYHTLARCVLPSGGGKNGKAPLVKWAPYQAKRPDDAQLEIWQATLCPNVWGMITGKISGCFVIDCDTPQAAAIMRGFQPHVKTPRGGCHYYIRYPDFPIQTEAGILSGVDVRGKGGFVNFCGSIGTASYEVLITPTDDSLYTFEQLPAELQKTLRPKRKGGARPTNEPGWVINALKGVSEGSRNATATKLVGYFREKVPQNICREILLPWAERCTPSFPPHELQAVITSVYRYGEPIQELREEDQSPLVIAKLPEVVWKDLFADYRDLVGPTTEAPDDYHYVCFAQVLGATLARRIHIYHARRLFPNFYMCLVGQTAVTRKDTARYRAARLFNDLHKEDNPENPQFQILPGIGSAEGLLDALGGERKVVVLTESELLSLLAKARQEALSNLIPKLTSLYDCPDLETLKTRQRNVVCREPFLAISTGTTNAWLQKALTEKDIYGGFANRFVYVHGIPKPPLPFPPKMDEDKYTALLSKINRIRLWADSMEKSEAKGELTVSDTTKAMFSDYYAEYHKRCAAETLPAALIPRVQTFVWKFALLYAAMDTSDQILPNHLEPAIHAGNCFEQSVLEIFRNFGVSRGKEVEAKLLAFLQGRGKGIPIPQREVYRGLNLSAAELEQAAKTLGRLGFIKNSTGKTQKGRSVACYEAL